VFDVSTIPNELLAASGRRFALFPVKTRAKSPLVKWPQVATHQLAQLAEWSGQFPDCNWGVATGQRSDIFVVDVDGARGIDSLACLCEDQELPDTLQAVTARGFHYYFRLPSGNLVPTTAGSLGAGVDVRGEGGYVVCPPSTHESGARYAYKNPRAPIVHAPAWLLDLLAKDRVGQSKFYKGNRNQMLTRIGGGLRRKGASQDELEMALLAENDNRCVPKLVVPEVRRIAQSLCRYGVGGPDVLARAWAKVEKREFATTYEKLLALFRQLQKDLPGQPVALPVERIAFHLGCDWSLVRRYRQRAVRDGFIVLAKAYIYRDKKAALYEVREEVYH
jgi:hypothetical protein